jgi:protoporphyrinogen oxidase
VAGVELDDGSTVPCNRVISTLPMELVAELLPEEYAEYAADLRRIRYIGVVCAVFKLKKPVTRNFWLNINDSRVACNGIIEYTNLNPMKELDGHIAYVPYYVATDQAPYTTDDEAVFRQSWDALRHVSPGLTDDDRIAWKVFRSAHAQAICPTHFLDLIPDWRTPIDGLFLTDSIFLYPEDRTQSGLIWQALQCAEAAAS